MNPALNSPFAFEEAYQLFLDGLLSNNRQQCRASFEQWLEATAELRTLYEDLVAQWIAAVESILAQARQQARRTTSAGTNPL